MTKLDLKTNAIRILEQKKIKFGVHTYISDGAISGEEVALQLNQNPNHVFKTLVTVGKSNKYYVFVIPVNKELDLKKAAIVVNEKYVEMIKSKDLLQVTGYIHGGCSPIGMKKQFTTTIHETAANYDTIIFSAGKIGYQIEMNVNDLNKVINFTIASLVEGDD